MSAVDVPDVSHPADARQRLLDVALALIARHGFAGTSLQMIADDLGVTKAAIYYHFRTRDQLLIGLVEPMLYQIRQFVEEAEKRRTPRMQMNAMVEGYAVAVARNRSLAAVLVFDPSVHRVLQHQPTWGSLIARQLKLLTQLDDGPRGVIKATALMTGLAGAATGAPAETDEQSLTAELSEIGRHMMGLRQPRQPRGAA
ncbi:TetR/AcrR family transcriptional regulator [Gordonia sp. SID5947]|uniref:TetR/AcrR family transcriptional regulator n=1 Tax=Gordonia sp. SID5947 TaxID=2690315 RepID=UPI0031BAF3A6